MLIAHVAARHAECAYLLQVICTKVRDGDKRIVRLKEGEPRGRHVVIVDDLVQSGGTLRECQKLLSSQVGSPPPPSLPSKTYICCMSCMRQSTIDPYSTWAMYSVRPA